MGQHLRGPTPPPDIGGFFGRVEGLDRIETWLRQHAVTPPSSSRGRPSLLVLHGPAGVGKSALAAEACRRRTVVTHWISLYDAAHAAVEPTLLRLLGESGGSRAAIVRAAVGDDRAFRQTLRHELSRHLPGRLLVLDGATPSVALPLLNSLADCPGLAVLVTTRQKSGWRRSGARLIAVDALDEREARDIFVAFGDLGANHDVPYRLLVDAAQGLPALTRVAGAVSRNEATRWSERQEGESRPQWLVRLALTGCTPHQRGALRRLATRNSAAPFTLRTFESMYPLDSVPGGARSVLYGLLAQELVQRWNGDETFCLPQPVADAVRTVEPSSPVTPAGEPDGLWADRVLQDTAGLLDGRPLPEQHTHPGHERLTPDELVPHVDEFMSLLSGHNPRSGWQQSTIADGLAVLLAVLGDAHRLVALHRLRPIPPVRRALGSLAADLGLPKQATALFDADTWVSPDAVHQGAAACHQSGRLDGALSVLDVLLGDDARPEDRHTAWALLVLGAVRCDRGEVAEAEQALVRAATLHRALGCRRGLGWALLHNARMCLLSGREAEAGRLLDEADEQLLAVSDTRGRNWVVTERLRLALRRVGPEAALELARRAEVQHKAAEDLRGRAWTSLYLALTRLEEGHVRSVREELTTAEQLFQECGDDLGSAWAKHRIGLFPSPGSRDHSATALASLGPVWALFGEIGCPLGTAWTELEMVARRKPSDLNLPLLDTAEGRFRALGDAYGLIWVAAVRAVHQNHLPWDGLRTARSLVASVPHDLPDRERVVRELRQFWEGRGMLGRRIIPIRARDRMAVRHTGPDFLELPGPAGPRCRVRVTLLDDSPAEDTTARLLLRVSPEDGHPWRAAEAERPWLTVTAVPLTHASVDPASGLLLPSEQAVHGAEFGFTAHRTGTHRIRFTITLERTGTVLQQVETELDILDHDERAGLSSPEAVTHRGR